MEIRNWWQTIQCNYTFKLLSYSPNVPQNLFFFSFTLLFSLIITIFQDKENNSCAEYTVQIVSVVLNHSNFMVQKPSPTD